MMFIRATDTQSVTQMSIVSGELGKSGTVVLLYVMA
jgi:hypothetical protein